MSLQHIYDMIRNDPRVVNEYARITENDKHSPTAFTAHDLGHVVRVVQQSENISKILNLDDEKIAEIKIAALLHDIGCATSGKNGHAQKSYEWAKKYLANFDIEIEIKHSILEAIKEHSGQGSGLCGKIVVAADKIDIIKDRILSLGFSVQGLKEYAHILSVNVQIKGDCFVVCFESDGKVNIKEMGDYYFSHKIFDAIKDLANYLGLSYKIQIDNKTWKL